MVAKEQTQYHLNQIINHWIIIIIILDRIFLIPLLTMSHYTCNTINLLFYNYFTTELFK